ncbi:protein rtoA-like [Tigriopus californicus]|uniref:protein rtoA-like n=1 Tax=Tigriopus californicus TaxID=6832 RepID=UPI0027D9D662|nr:protein rtoA-like [Tigriopus californicus]
MARSQVSFALLSCHVLEARNLPNSLADQFIRRLQKRAADAEADPEPVAQEQDSYGIPNGSPVGSFGSSNGVSASGSGLSSSNTYNSGSTSFSAPISAVGAQYSAGSSSVSAPVVSAGNSYSGPSNTGSVSSSNSYNGPSSSSSSSSFNGASGASSGNSYSGPSQASASSPSSSSYSGPLLTSVPASVITNTASQASYGSSQDNCQVTRSLTNTGNCQQGGQVVVEPCFHVLEEVEPFVSN